MTERWEQRLKTLDGVRAPASIQARFERGPTDLQAPPPSTARRVVAGVVAFALFAAAGVFAWRVLTPTGPTVGESSAPVVTATFDIGAPIVQGSSEEAFPRGRLTALGRTIQGAPNSYTWKIDGGEVNADTIVPDFTSKDYLQIQQGSQLEIEGTADSVTGQLQATGTFPFDLVQDYGTIEDPLMLDAPIGRYVLNLAPSWPEGRVNYYFPIDIVEADPVASSALALSVVGGAEGPQASITSGTKSQEGIRGEFKWCDGSGSCESGISDFGEAQPLVKFIPVAGGTPLKISGQLRELKGGFFKEGERIVSRVTLEEPGSVPREAGFYYLEIHTAIDGEGSARGTATFWLGIEATGEGGEPSPTTPPSPSEPVEEFFVPPTTTQGSTTTLPLVFPDGSRAVLAYPKDLLLAERGIAPNLLIHLNQGDRCGWDGIIGYGSLHDTVYEGDGPTFSVDGESSHVEIWQGAKGYLPQYLVIRKGPWELTTPCPRSPQIEDEAAAWADHLTLTTSPEGYLVVKVTDPLVIEGPEAGASFSGPELYFLGGAPSVEGATGILSIGIATRCPEGEGFRRQPGWARGCFVTGDGAVIMTIQTEGNRPAERANIDAIVEGVEVPKIALAP